MNTTLRRTLITISAAALGIGIFFGTQTGTAASSPTAEQVVSQFHEAGLPLTGVTNVTAETDRNHLLGRPGGYITKVEFADSRIGTTTEGVVSGGSVEVYPTHTQATNRATYIATMRKKMPMFGTEYDYVTGNAVIRISGQLTPDQAQAYKNAAH